MVPAVKRKNVPRQATNTDYTFQKQLSNFKATNAVDYKYIKQQYAAVHDMRRNKNSDYTCYGNLRLLKAKNAAHTRI